MKVLVLTEMEPDLAPPGIRRRYEHISEWLGGHEVEWHHDAVLTSEEASSSKMTRFLATMMKLRYFDRKLPGDAVVLVLGLGAAHMLILAAYLRIMSRRSRRVAYDTCDSWILQVRARFRTGGLSLAFPALLGLIIQASLGRCLFISYISQKDQVADRLLNARNSSFVVRPVPSLALGSASGLDAVNGRIQRICVSADYDAFHNDKGMALLKNAWESADIEASCLELHLYGKGEPPTIQGAVSRGWADDIRDVYRGNTAVYIPNIDGSGVPNKLIDALSSHRPVLAHKSVSDGLQSNSRVLVFENGTELADLLVRLPGIEFYDENTDSSRVLSDMPHWMVAE